MCELKIVQKKMPHCKPRVWLMYEINLRRFKWKTYSACVFPKRHKIEENTLAGIADISTGKDCSKQDSRAEEIIPRVNK